MPALPQIEPVVLDRQRQHCHRAAQRQVVRHNVTAVFIGVFESIIVLLFVFKISRPHGYAFSSAALSGGYVYRADDFHQVAEP